MLKRLNKYFELLKEFCIENSILFSNENWVFFKVIKANGLYIAKNMAQKSTMKEILNCFLSYETHSEFKGKF